VELNVNRTALPTLSWNIFTFSDAAKVRKMPALFVSSIDEHDLDTLKMLLSNQKRSGGGTITSCDFVRRKEGLVKVIYEDPKGNKQFNSCLVHLVILYGLITKTLLLSYRGSLVLTILYYESILCTCLLYDECCFILILM